MRRRGDRHQTVQPWHRRYRIYILVPLILGYAMIYGCRNAPLRLVDRIEVRYESIDDGAAMGEGENAQGEP